MMSLFPLLLFSTPTHTKVTVLYFFRSLGVVLYELCVLDHAFKGQVGHYDYITMQL